MIAGHASCHRLSNAEDCICAAMDGRVACKTCAAMLRGVQDMRSSAAWCVRAGLWHFSCVSRPANTPCLAQKLKEMGHSGRPCRGCQNNKNQQRNKLTHKQTHCNVRSTAAWCAYVYQMLTPICILFALLRSDLYRVSVVCSPKLRRDRNARPPPRARIK